MTTLIPAESIEKRIMLIRGQRVMIDRDLARLYAVETKHLNRQVRRNPGRFPEEFMFQLTSEERDEVVTNWRHLSSLKFSRSLPCAFTEHGVAMLASVLKSERAVRISVGIVRAFIKLRLLLASQGAVSRKLQALEGRIEGHDDEIKSIFRALRRLMEPPTSPKRRIGFLP